MRVIDIVQRSPEWHGWRSAGMSASDAPVVLGVSPFKTRWRLWAEKCGLAFEEDLSGNPYVRRGLEEEDIRRVYEDRHGVLLLPLCAESDAHPVVRASFDGLTDEGEPVEIKSAHHGRALRTSLSMARDRRRSSAISPRSSNRSTWRTQRGDR
jgi:putative phage-type endonuclease